MKSSIFISSYVPRRLIDLSTSIDMSLMKSCDLGQKLNLFQFNEDRPFPLLLDDFIAEEYAQNLKTNFLRTSFKDMEKEEFNIRTEMIERLLDHWRD